MMPLGFGAPSFQAGQDLIVRVVCSQVQAEVESRCAQQPKQCSQCELPLITLVGRDHRDRNSGPLSESRWLMSALSRANCKSADDGDGNASATSG
jgi:hypothetical protein